MTYIGLAGIYIAVAAVFLVLFIVRERPVRGWLIALAATTGALLVLTAIFDAVMIAVDLYRYPPEALVGIKLGNVPIEDFAWPIVAVLVVPAAYALFSKKAGGDK